MLYAESVASFLLLDSLLYGQNVIFATDKMIAIYRRAQDRCARRFKIAYK